MEYIYLKEYIRRLWQSSNTSNLFLLLLRRRHFELVIVNLDQIRGFHILILVVLEIRIAHILLLNCTLW